MAIFLASFIDRAQVSRSAAWIPRSLLRWISSMDADPENCRKLIFQSKSKTSVKMSFKS